MTRLLLLAALAPAVQAGIKIYNSDTDCSSLTSDFPLEVDKCGEFSSLFGMLTCAGKEVTLTQYSDKDCTAKIGDLITATDGVCQKYGTGSLLATCGGAPCFSRDNTHAIMTNGESVLMTSLKSGDIVMDGPHSSTRIIVNQHAKADTLTSGLLKIEHSQGDLSLTPDHVLSVDGTFVAAREAKVGTKLGESEVSRVTTFTGGIINPLTASGKILTQGGVLASTYPEWIASYMLASYVPLPFSVSNLISYLFPETTQAYYDAVLESFFQSTSPTLMNLKAALPAPLVALVFILADLSVAAGFIAFSLANFKVALALAAIATIGVKSRK